MTGEAERKHALQAVELGAYDFFRKPVDKGELLLVLRRALERSRILAENKALKDESGARRSFDAIVGASAPMRALFAKIEKVAGTDVTVLLQGESGTGKELVAEALHRGSPRSAGPFVAVNGSALPEGLAESELFGHEKGSFTGAVAARTGKFEQAHGGTLFLDEVVDALPRDPGEAPPGPREPRVRAGRREEDHPCGHPPRGGVERGPRAARRRVRSGRTSSTG